MRFRHFGAMALSAVVAIGLAPAAQAQSTTHAAAPRATPGTSPSEFYFASGEGDYIGAGATVDNTDPVVSLTANYITVTAAGWNLTLAAPTGQDLAVGTYTGALRFNTATAPEVQIFGDGRGCNQDFGTFTVYEDTATSFNATFSQTCESTTAPPLVGFIRYNATLTTPVPTLPSTALPITPPPNSGTTSANADEFSFQSGEGDYIGGGIAVDYVGPTNASVGGDLGVATVNAGGWTLDLAAPSGQQLVPGTYTGATSYPFTTTGAPSISLSGNGRGCDQYYGTFTIYEIASDPTGALTLLNATFSQTCESTTAAPLVGFIRFNATAPTPMPTLASTALPITAPPNSGTTSANADELFFRSGEGDYIGGGATVDYVGPTNVSVGGDLGVADAGAGGTGSWTLDLSAPNGQELVPGTYTGATRYPFNTGASPGLTVSGNGAGCNQDFGTFTIYQIASSPTGALTQLNATFSQTCESTTAAPLVGFIRFNATIPTPIPTLPSTALPITAPPNSGTTSANADEFSFLSAPGDYIGDGATVDYVGPTNVSIAGTLGVAEVFAGGWELDLAAPNGQQLVPGTYAGAAGYPATAAGTPGISLSGDSRGCSGFGTFTIYQIASNPAGALTQLNATFSQTCENSTSPLVGFIRFNATVPTPIPTLPPGSVPLSAQLAPSSGAANANGTTVVTLNASGSTGTDSNASYSFNFGDGAAATTSSNPVATRPEYEGTYEVTVTITDGSKTSTSAPQWLTVGAGYHALSPTRLLDTRYGIGGATHPVASMSSITLQLPASVTASGHGPLSAVVLNVTVTQPTAPGDIKVYPSGVPQPSTSNLNYVAGETVANLVTVPMASISDGKVVLYVHSAGSAELIADLEGYYTDGNDPTNAGYAPLTPTRIMDTRYGVGHSGKVGAYGTVALPVPSSVPANATALVMNVTAVNTTSTGDLKVYPAGGSGVPNVSNLNFAAGQIVPNLVIVPISSARTVDFYLESHGAADLIADLEGYFSPTATSKFVASYPTRLFDTRNGDAGGALPGGYAITASMAYALDVPVSALTASLYNVTVTQPQGPGFITVFPDGLQAVPNVSNLNFVTNETVPNAVLASMTDGDQDFYNGGTKPTQLIVDFFGYFAKPLATDAPPTSAAVGKRVVRTAP